MSDGTEYAEAEFHGGTFDGYSCSYEISQDEAIKLLCQESGCEVIGPWDKLLEMLTGSGPQWHNPILLGSNKVGLEVEGGERGEGVIWYATWERVVVWRIRSDEELTAWRIESDRKLKEYIQKINGTY